MRNIPVILALLLLKMDNIEKTIRFVYSNQSKDWYSFSKIACKFRERLRVLVLCVQAE